MVTRTNNQRAARIWLGEETTNAMIIQNLAVVSRIWNEIWNKGLLETSNEVFSN